MFHKSKNVFKKKNRECIGIYMCDMTGLLFFLFLWKWSWWSTITGHRTQAWRKRETRSDFAVFHPKRCKYSQCALSVVTFEMKRSEWRLYQMKKGHGKLHWHFLCNSLKITHCSISVTSTAMGKATNITSKAHYAIFFSFLKGEAAGWKCFFCLSLFSRPLHVSDKFFHSAAFSYQSSLIANVERLNRFSSLKKKEKKKGEEKQRLFVQLMHWGCNG